MNEEEEEKAREMLESLIVIGDNEDIRIAKRNRQFSTKKNSYDVMTDNIGVAVRTKNKDITWIQLIKGNKMLVETRDYAFWIVAGTI